MDTKYAKAKDLAANYEEAVEQVIEALKGEGFGVLTRIDVKATMKEKLDVDFVPYVILGACNPPLAHQALSNEEAVGILMPCNVVVKALPEGGSRVFMTDVSAVFSLIDKDEIAPLAAQVDDKLSRVLESLS